MRKLGFAVAAALLALGLSASVALADHGAGHNGSAPGVRDNPVLAPGEACGIGAQHSEGTSAGAISGHPGTGKGAQGNETCIH